MVYYKYIILYEKIYILSEKQSFFYVFYVQ